MKKIIFPISMFDQSESNIVYKNYKLKSQDISLSEDHEYVFNVPNLIDELSYKITDPELLDKEIDKLPGFYKLDFSNLSDGVNLTINQQKYGNDMVWNYADKSDGYYVDPSTIKHFPTFNAFTFNGYLSSNQKNSRSASSGYFKFVIKAKNLNLNLYDTNTRNYFSIDCGEKNNIKFENKYSEITFCAPKDKVEELNISGTPDSSAEFRFEFNLKSSWVYPKLAPRPPFNTTISIKDFKELKLPTLYFTAPADVNTFINIENINTLFLPPPEIIKGNDKHYSFKNVKTLDLTKVMEDLPWLGITKQTSLIDQFKEHSFKTDNQMIIKFEVKDKFEINDKKYEKTTDFNIPISEIISHYDIQPDNNQYTLTFGQVSDFCKKVKQLNRAKLLKEFKKQEGIKKTTKKIVLNNSWLQTK